MSSNIHNIAIFSNLPSGGASEMAKENIQYLKQKANISFISEENLYPKNILDYLYICIFNLKKLHRQLARKISKENDVIIAYHSWLTKSPYILRYSSLPKIYICQEVMREYYDDRHINNQTLKDKIINIIRMPVKYIDKSNLRSKNLIVVANSKFSKKMIDMVYNVKSLVLYPGINTDKFERIIVRKKLNQVISVGAINSLKGYEFLIEVISKIEKSIRPKFIIVGNGYNKAYLNRIVTLAKTLNVTLKIKVGISEKELIREYHKSKLFLYSPLNEPFGIVVEEAMACGLPLVVAIGGGGYNEIITEKNGLILSRNNHSNWAEAISDLLVNEKILIKYGEYNKSYVKKFYNSKIMNNNLWDVIKSL